MITSFSLLRCLDGGLIFFLIFFSQDGGLLERVGLFKEGRLSREDAAFHQSIQIHICVFIYIYIDIYIDIYIYISSFIRKSIFNIIILFPGLPSQSSFVQGHFKCSFKSMQSSFENHNSCRCYWIWYSETNIESIHVHNIFEANFVIFW